MRTRLLRYAFVIASVSVLSLDYPSLASKSLAQGQQAPALTQQDSEKYAAAVAKYARTPKNEAEFDKLFKDVSNWGRWGAKDELGTANLVKETKRKQAASLVKLGISVSLSHPLEKVKGIDNPSPVEFKMAPSLGGDTMTLSPHGLVHSHIDAQCHYPYKGQYYNGFKRDEVVTEQQGCMKLGIQNLKDGIVTRGILLDIPRLKGVQYLEPGTPVFPEDIEAGEKKAGLRISSGDAVLLHTGRWIRREKFGPWAILPSPPNAGEAGYHVSVVPAIMKARDVAFVGADVGQEVFPSYVEGVNTPNHWLLISSLGMFIFDHQDLTELAATCARLNRWEFMLTGAPLYLPGSTGTAINLIATF